MSKRRRRKEDNSDLVKRDGALALTFVNTGSRRSRRLQDFAELLAWCERHGGLTASDARRLELLAAESPHLASEGFAMAEELHGLLSTIMNARANRVEPPSAALAGLNVFLAKAVPQRCLVKGRSFMQWEWPAHPEQDPSLPLWAVALSATDLLTSPSYGKVKRCKNEACDVLFLANRAGSPRKWCDMRSCGNPLRSRRYYLRVTKPQNKAWRERLARGEIDLTLRPKTSGE